MPYLTDELIRGLPKPVGKNAITWDADADGAPGSGLTGFGLVMTPGGARTFVYNYRTKASVQRRITVGRFPTVKVEAARKKARAHAQQVGLGDDPQAKRAAARWAAKVSELAERFMAEHVVPNRR